MIVALAAQAVMSPESSGVKAEPSITPMTTRTPLRSRPGEPRRTPPRLARVVVIRAPSSHGSGRSIR